MQYFRLITYSSFLFAGSRFEQPFTVSVQIRGLKSDQELLSTAPKNPELNSQTHNRTRVLRCSHVSKTIFLWLKTHGNASLPFAKLTSFFFILTNNSFIRNLQVVSQLLPEHGPIHLVFLVLMNRSYPVLIGSITICNENLFSSYFCFLLGGLNSDIHENNPKMFSELAHSQEAKAVGV